MNQIILTIMCSAVVFPPLIGGAAPVPDQVPCAIADRQDFQQPDRLHLTGWIGSRIDANEKNRLVMMDPNRLLISYRKRPGGQEWDGEHVGKWLHAATLAWVYTGDPELRKKLDYTATELVKCQLEDGYLGTYTNEKRWTDWDVWTHKYNLIGLVTYIRHTGNMDVLPACRKLADLLCNTFGDGPGKRDIIPAGEHIGLAPGSVLEPIVQFYRLTGEPSYLDFSKYLMRAFEQPNGPIIVSQLLELKRVDAVGDAKAVFAGASVLVMQLETPLETVQAAADLAVKAGVRVILNPAPAQPLPDKLLQSVSILTPNETEAELLTGIAVTDSASAAAAAAKLRARGVQTVIITLGARGAYVATESDERLVPGFNVKAMDTTAAGDVFNGALAVAIAEGKPLELAVRFANAAAAISVTRLGAQPSAPTRREIERFLKK